jgi:hypothetical protein
MKKTFYTLVTVGFYASSLAQTNKNLKLDSTVTANYDKSSAKEVMRYQYDGFISEYESYSKNANNPSYILKNRTDYTSKNGNILSYTNSNLQNLQNVLFLLPYRSSEYFYKDNLQEYSINFNERTNPRTKTDSIASFYSNNGLLVENQIFRWANNNWSPSGRTSYTYDEAGRITEISSYQCSFDIYFCEMRNKQTFKFYPDGKLSEQKHYEFTEIGQFRHEFYHTYSENTDTVKTYDYLPFGETESKSIYTYKDSNLVKIENFSWNDSKEEYDPVPSSVQIFTYDLRYVNGQAFTNEVFKSPYPTNIRTSKNLISTYESWYRDTDVLKFQSKKYYYYSTFIPTGIFNDKAEEHLSLYPNPTDGILNITLPQNTNTYTWQIYDMLGANVMEGEANDSEQPISVEGLQSGTYMLIVNTGETSQSYKFYKK